MNVTIDRPRVRKLLNALLTTDEELDAFIIDYFPGFKKGINLNSSPIAKTNALIEQAEATDIFKALQLAYPEESEKLIGEIWKLDSQESQSRVDESIVDSEKITKQGLSRNLFNVENLQLSRRPIDRIAFLLINRLDQPSGNNIISGNTINANTVNINQSIGSKSRYAVMLMIFLVWALFAISSLFIESVTVLIIVGIVAGVILCVLALILNHIASTKAQATDASGLPPNGALLGGSISSAALKAIVSLILIMLTIPAIADLLGFQRSPATPPPATLADLGSSADQGAASSDLDSQKAQEDMEEEFDQGVFVPVAPQQPRPQQGRRQIKLPKMPKEYVEDDKCKMASNLNKHQVEMKIIDHVRLVHEWSSVSYDFPQPAITELYNNFYCNIYYLALLAQGDDESIDILIICMAVDILEYLIKDNEHLVDINKNIKNVQMKKKELAEAQVKNLKTFIRYLRGAADRSGEQCGP